MSSHEASDAREDGASRPAFLTNEPSLPSGLTVWLFAASLAAGLLAWLAGESSLMWVAPKQVPMVTMGTHHNATTTATEQAAVGATASRINGVFGALLGLALGTAGGLAIRSSGNALRSAALGTVLGAFTAGAAALGATRVFYRSRDVIENELIASLLLHYAMWVAVALPAALALSLGTGSRRVGVGRALMGGAFGALLGTAVFEFAGAVVFPTDDAGEPISTTALSRLLARLCVALFTALGIWAMFVKADSAAASTAPSSSRAQGDVASHDLNTAP